MSRITKCESFARESDTLQPLMWAHRSWRFPLAFQAALAVGTAAFVPFLVESPRWLCLKDRHQEARVVISRLLDKPLNDREVTESLELMTENIMREKAEGKVGWKEVFYNGPGRTRQR